MTFSLKLCFIPLTSLVLTGCGGGGGSSSTLTPFTSWAAIQGNSVVVATGISQRGTVTFDNTGKVTSRVQGAPLSEASVTTTFNGNKEVVKITISPANSASITWSDSADTFSQGGPGNTFGSAKSANGQDFVLTADPFKRNWSYQSYGVWATGVGSIAGVGTYGATSFGLFTGHSAIPTAGTGTYIGDSAGLYISSAGETQFTYASMTANADFANRTVAFSTSNTIGSETGSLSDLNITGTLSYHPNSNQMTGVVMTNSLTGNANAKFYGPAAEEIGGTFSFVGAGGSLETYTGAFGGKK